MSIYQIQKLIDKSLCSRANLIPKFSIWWLCFLLIASQTLTYILPHLLVLPCPLFPSSPHLSRLPFVCTTAMSEHTSGRLDSIIDLMPRWQVDNRKADSSRTGRRPPLKQADSPPFIIDRPSTWTIEKKAAFLDLILAHAEERPEDSDSQQKISTFLNYSDWRAQHGTLTTKLMTGLVSSILVNSCKPPL